VYWTKICETWCMSCTVDCWDSRSPLLVHILDELNGRQLTLHCHTDCKLILTSLAVACIISLHAELTKTCKTCHDQGFQLSRDKSAVSSRTSFVESQSKTCSHQICNKSKTCFVLIECSAKTDTTHPTLVGPCLRTSCYSNVADISHLQLWEKFPSKRNRNSGQKRS